MTRLRSWRVYQTDFHRGNQEDCLGGSWRRRAIGGAASVGVAAVLGIAGCSGSQSVTYSLEDREVYRAAAQRPLRVAVMLLEDKRPGSEIGPEAFTSELPLPGHRRTTDSGFGGRVAEQVTRQLVRHLRTAAVFSTVELAEASSDGGAFLRTLTEVNYDATLSGVLRRFYGQVGPDGRIVAQTQVEALKLVSTKTGEVMWQGEATKWLDRVELRPRSPYQYASESLRGAANQIAMRLVEEKPGGSRGGSAVPGQSRKPDSFLSLRIGVARFEDRRPVTERSTQERSRTGESDPDLFTSDERVVNQLRPCGLLGVCSQKESTPFDLPAELANRIAAGLDRAGLFASVRVVSDSQSEGLDGILTGHIAHFVGGARPPRNQVPFSLLSGGTQYTREWVLTGQASLEDVRLVRSSDGDVLWAGAANGMVQERVRVRASPWDPAFKALDLAIQELLNELQAKPPTP